MTGVPTPTDQVIGTGDGATARLRVRHCGHSAVRGVGHDSRRGRRDVAVRGEHGLPAAADNDGTVTGVDFYAGSTLLGTDTSSPYSFTWSNAPAGTYLMTAVATDNGGAAGSSPIIAVTVKPAGSLTTVSFRNGIRGYNGMIDTHIRRERATTCYGNATRLKADGNPEFAILLRWDLSAVPAGVKVTDATLTFNVTDVSSNVYEFYALGRAWNESWSIASRSASPMMPACVNRR